jgi:hypothetical protein
MTRPLNKSRRLSANDARMAIALAFAFAFTLSAIAGAIAAIN